MRQRKGGRGKRQRKGGRERAKEIITCAARFTRILERLVKCICSSLILCIIDNPEAGASPLPLCL